jgi:hypothetical protein
VRRHYWRVAEHFATPEDALAECALIWCRCLRKYEHSVDNPAWFMSLYTRAVSNDFTTYARVATQRRALICYARSEDDEVVQDQGATDDNLGYLLTLLGDASAELRQVLGMLANAPAEVLDSLLDGSPADMNKRWCRRAGIKQAADLVGELKKLLT